MTRKQAGVLAVGVLAVAIAIVILGGFFGQESPPPSERPTAALSNGSGSGAPKSEIGGASDSARSGNVAPTTATQTVVSPAVGESPAESGANIVRDKAAAGKGAGGSSASVAGQAPRKSASGTGENMASIAPAPNDRADATPGSTGGADVTPGSTGGAVVAPGSTGGSAPKTIVPSFDLLRVEPDGSTVIAGRAAPGSKIEILDKNGNKPLLTTKADETGSFVAVFDAPLAPGNHELVLKSIAKDKSTSYSEDVATVSVPKDRKASDLLAMVSKPGEASRIVTAPEPTSAIGQAEEGGSSRTAAAEVAGVNPSGESAAASGAVRSGRPQADSASPAKIHVDAVEVEGGRIYVAGAAPRGLTVRIYADDKYVGESQATGEGRFVVNGKDPIEPGQHKVRADLVDPATGKVTMRATVSFDRPAGGHFAAISPQVAGSAPSETKSAPSRPGEPATVVQPALTNSDNFVIIRRGDTLWQISRRTYGRGIRYTTIYLANSEQISDPNLILPGQVFDVPRKPEKTVDQAIELHHELLRKEGRVP